MFFCVLWKKVIHTGLKPRDGRIVIFGWTVPLTFAEVCIFDWFPRGVNLTQQWMSAVEGVCFCLKSNLPRLWLMSLRVERSTALPGLFVPGADGNGRGTVCSTQGWGADWRTLTPTHYHQQLGSVNPHTHMRVYASLKCTDIHAITSVILMLPVWSSSFDFFNLKFKCCISNWN